jgi:hypothetical protein
MDACAKQNLANETKSTQIITDRRSSYCTGGLCGYFPCWRRPMVQENELQELLLRHSVVIKSIQQSQGLLSDGLSLCLCLALTLSSEIYSLQELFQLYQPTIPSLVAADTTQLPQAIPPSTEHLVLRDVDDLVYLSELMNSISEVLAHSNNWKKSENKILPVIAIVTHVSLSPFASWLSC